MYSEDIESYAQSEEGDMRLDSSNPYLKWNRQIGKNGQTAEMAKDKVEYHVLGTARHYKVLETLSKSQRFITKLPDDTVKTAQVRKAKVSECVQWVCPFAS